MFLLEKTGLVRTNPISIEMSKLIVRRSPCMFKYDDKPDGPNNYVRN